jgi:hypothetical protein
MQASIQDQRWQLPVDESGSASNHVDKIRMLSLDSPRWGELSHAYGSANDAVIEMTDLNAADMYEWLRER